MATTYGHFVHFFSLVHFFNLFFSGHHVWAHQRDDHGGGNQAVEGGRRTGQDTRAGCQVEKEMGSSRDTILSVFQGQRSPRGGDADRGGAPEEI